MNKLIQKLNNENNPETLKNLLDVNAKNIKDTEKINSNINLNKIGQNIKLDESETDLNKIRNKIFGPEADDINKEDKIKSKNHNKKQKKK